MQLDASLAAAELLSVDDDAPEDTSPLEVLLYDAVAMQRELQSVLAQAALADMLLRTFRLGEHLRAIKVYVLMGGRGARLLALRRHARGVAAPA